MKKRRVLIALCVIAEFVRAQINDPGQVAQQGATNHVNNNINSGVDNGLNKTENTIKGLFKKKNKAAKTDTASQSSGATAQAARDGQTGVQTGNGQPGAMTGNNGQTGSPAAATGPAAFKMYSNYDFVPGQQILFDDEFTDDQDGEFPAHWILQKGQGILNKVDSNLAFFLTEG